MNNEGLLGHTEVEREWNKVGEMIRVTKLCDGGDQIHKALSHGHGTQYPGSDLSLFGKGRHRHIRTALINDYLILCVGSRDIGVRVKPFGQSRLLSVNKTF